MPVKTHGSAVFGVDATTITIEVNIGSGQISCYTMGLTGREVKKILCRIIMAVKHIKYKMPRQRVVINVTLAHIRKAGFKGLDCTQAKRPRSRQRKQPVCV